MPALPSAVLLLTLLLPGPARDGAGWDMALCDRDARLIADRIWLNESGKKFSGLTHWNRGERFASLGVGHFIWYPAGQRGPFEESFPRFIAFLEERKVVLPSWLDSRTPCPWPDRAAFLKEKDSPRTRELRRLLARTVDLQARFMAQRLENALPRITRALPEERRALVRRRFLALARRPEGLYALMDYVNFKGEGLSPSERYRGSGWGLLQVLEAMRGDGSGPQGLEDFSASARDVLVRRVLNAPEPKKETSWLLAWSRRVSTYRASSAA
ncbi:MAG TPA: hypothetical protein DCM05_11595 [Elusimicrobia bacterium]|nr:hypothetical protein [Elusimicrobiota bacterium]